MKDYSMCAKDDKHRIKHSSAAALPQPNNTPLKTSKTLSCVSVDRAALQSPTTPHVASYKQIYQNNIRRMTKFLHVVGHRDNTATSRAPQPMHISRASALYNRHNNAGPDNRQLTRGHKYPRIICTVFRGVKSQRIGSDFFSLR